MTSSPKGTALITNASSGVGTVDHADRFSYRGIVISPIDRKQQFRWLICSIATSLLAVLPATTQRSGISGTTHDIVRRRSGNRKGRHLRANFLLLLIGSSLLAYGQSGNVSTAPTDQPSPAAQGPPSPIRDGQPDELKQELDADAIALSKIPADPLIQPDPVAPILRPINMLVDHSIHSLRLKFGATYTVLNQYATITPDGSGTINPADASISPERGLCTIMKTLRDPSACSFVPERTLP